MNIYYTAKDIEELSAKGVQQLEIGPGVSLTDFARETAQQLNIDLVEGGGKAPPPAAPASPSKPAVTSDKYNKPSGCQHAASANPATRPQAVVPSSQSAVSTDPNTMNRLIDLVGKAIKRGG